MGSHQCQKELTGVTVQALGRGPADLHLSRESYGAAHAQRASLHGVECRVSTSGVKALRAGPSSTSGGAAPGAIPEEHQRNVDIVAQRLLDGGPGLLAS